MVIHRMNVGALVRWLLSAAAVWYWWRIYSLSFNPGMFPDPKYAESIWNRRSTRSFVLGAIIATGVLAEFGLVRGLWSRLIAFAIFLFVVGLVQPLLVGLVVFHRTGCVILRAKAGLKPHPPRLAPFAWNYYLAEEETVKNEREHDSE
jgi:hypothetical protein